MHTSIFRVIAGFLLLIARVTGRTYNEINILVYYFAIPFSWLILLDLIFHCHYFKILFAGYYLGFFFGCRNFRAYSDWLFRKSVNFLLYFNKFGSNYVKSSVWICVSLPILIYTVLIWWTVKLI